MVVTRPRRQPRRGRAAAVARDTAAHAYVYRHMPEVGGVVHTHSTYATAWAARGEAIPCVLTMIADEFGGEVPVGPFALIGDDSIGRGIVETLRAQPLAGRADAQPRPVHRRHGRPRRRQGRRDGRGRRPHRARQPASSASRCAHRAGRRRRALRPVPERLRPAGARSERDVRVPRDLVPHREPGPLRPRGPRPGRRPVRRDRRGALDASDGVAGAGRRQAGADRGRRDPPGPARRRRPTTAASASSPGCTPSARRRCGSPGSTALRKPLLHLHTQANAGAAVGRRSTWTS